MLYWTLAERCWSRKCKITSGQTDGQGWTGHLSWTDVPWFSLGARGGTDVSNWGIYGYLAPRSLTGCCGIRANRKSGRFRITPTVEIPGKTFSQIKSCSFKLIFSNVFSIIQIIRTLGSIGNGPWNKFGGISIELGVAGPSVSQHPLLLLFRDQLQSLGAYPQPG